MTFTAQLLQYTVTGLTTGAVYALIAAGFVVIFGVTGVLNFAQGEFAMIGGLTAYSLVQAGLPLPLALVLAVAATAAAGALLERLAIHPARQSGPLTLVLITLGCSIPLRGLALLVWGTDSRVLPPFLPGPPLQLGGAALQRQGLVAFLAALALVGGLHLFFNLTLQGKAVQALVMNRTAARLVGIAPERMSLLAFTVSAALGAVAGAVVAPISSVSYGMGAMLTLKAFVAALLGGVTNAPAAILGGLVLGVAESLAVGLVSSPYKDAIAFVLLMVMLLFRPSGLFGRMAGKRV